MGEALILCRDDQELFAAIERLDFDAVSNLLAAGANPNALDPLGATPLHRAVDAEIDAYSQLGQTDDPAGGPPTGRMVKLLLESGADPSLCDPFGRNALDDAADCGWPMKTPKYEAAHRIMRSYGARHSQKYIGEAKQLADHWHGSLPSWLAQDLDPV